jgi:hypothetical protein
LPSSGSAEVPPLPQLLLLAIVKEEVTVITIAVAIVTAAVMLVVRIGA